MRKKSLGDEFELLDINGSVLMRGCSVFTLFLQCMQIGIYVYKSGVMKERLNKRGKEKGQFF